MKPKKGNRSEKDSKKLKNRLKTPDAAKRTLEISKVKELFSGFMRSKPKPPIGLVNRGFEPMPINLHVNRHFLETIAENDHSDEEETVVSVTPERKRKNRQIREDSIKTKRNKLETGVENSAFGEPCSSEKETTVKKRKSKTVTFAEKNQFEIEAPVKKVKKSKKPEDSGLVNVAFNEEIPVKNPYEVETPVKSKKLKIAENLGCENVAFDENSPKSSSDTEKSNKYEVKRKKRKNLEEILTPSSAKKIQGIENPSFFDSKDEAENEVDFSRNLYNQMVDNYKTQNSTNLPNLSGNNEAMFNFFMDFMNFLATKQEQRIGNNFESAPNTPVTESFSRKTPQKEVIEDQIGEKTRSGRETSVVQGGIRLKYEKNCLNLTENPVWMKKNDRNGPISKQTYKHLIQGDIILNFNQSNLDRIKGYGQQNQLNKSV